jgi:hypothetical protein
LNRRHRRDRQHRQTTEDSLSEFDEPAQLLNRQIRQRMKSAPAIKMEFFA